MWWWRLLLSECDKKAQAQGQCIIEEKVKCRLRKAETASRGGVVYKQESSPMTRLSMPPSL